MARETRRENSSAAELAGYAARLGAENVRSRVDNSFGLSGHLRNLRLCRPPEV